MSSSFQIVRVDDLVRCVADISDANWSLLGNSRELRDRLAAAFPSAEFAAGAPGWCVVLRQEYDFVLEAATVSGPAGEDVSVVTVRIFPDLVPDRKRGNAEIVRERIRAVAEALGGVAFDDEARL
jgi:hypothetical protein